MQHITFTYYDSNSASSTAMQRDPSDVPFDLADMIGAAAGKPLVLTEVGYSSATNIGSSLAMQNSFYANTLAAFGAASGKLSGASFSFMSDFPAETVRTLGASYGAGGSSWVSWIAELGLFDSLSKAKPAWGTFQTQATALRNNIGCNTAY
jgi:hypothetical protein